MSTLPGDRTWQDAGLVEPALADVPEVAPDDADEGAGGDADAGEGGYRPSEPRPDLTDEADPADVAEQRMPVPGDERDDYP